LVEIIEKTQDEREFSVLSKTEFLEVPKAVERLRGLPNVTVANEDVHRGQD